MDKKTLIQELKLKAVRSSGAGGQHVNKVSTKVELTFDVARSKALSPIEKERIYKNLDSKITKEYLLILQADKNRSQSKNKEVVIKRLLALLETALKVPKKRKKTEPTKSSVKKRLESKKKRAFIKTNRKRPDVDWFTSISKPT